MKPQQASQSIRRKVVKGASFFVLPVIPITHPAHPCYLINPGTFISIPVPINNSPLLASLSPTTLLNDALAPGLDTTSIYLPPAQIDSWHTGVCSLDAILGPALLSDKQVGGISRVAFLTSESLAHAASEQGQTVSNQSSCQLLSSDMSSDHLFVKVLTFYACGSGAVEWGPSKAEER